MNEITVQTPTFDVSNIDNIVNQLSEVADELNVGGIQYIKFKKGEWVIGKAEDTFPENKFEALVNLAMVQNGWVCWKDGQLVDEKWSNLGDKKTSKEDLPDHGPYTQQNDGWSYNVRFEMQIQPTLGTENHILAQFTGSSKGAMKAVGEMVRDVVQQKKTGQHDNQVPIVLFHSDSYKHSQYGKVYIPKLSVSRWMDQADTVPVQGSKQEPDTQPTPTKDIPLE